MEGEGAIVSIAGAAEVDGAFRNLEERRRWRCPPIPQMTAPAQCRARKMIAHSLPVVAGTHCGQASPSLATRSALFKVPESATHLEAAPASSQQFTSPKLLIGTAAALQPISH